MKTKIVIFSLLAIILICCEDNDLQHGNMIDLSNLSFTGCSIVAKSSIVNIPKIKLIGQPNGKLTVKMINTEFCCGSDSVSTNKTVDLDEISIEIIDNGPFSYCYCPHDLEFSLSSFDNKEYELILIESEYAYSRDTFLIHFEYSEHLDTTITGFIPEDLISNYPLDHVKTDLGGCNGMFKSAIIDYVDEIDTLIFNKQSDTIKIFAGLNLTCCIDFGSESEISGDTLIMRINTLNDDFCDCICYYTFDYIYANYMGQVFYYKFYIDDYNRFEGKYNLP